MRTSCPLIFSSSPSPLFFIFPSVSFLLSYSPVLTFFNMVCISPISTCLVLSFPPISMYISTHFHTIYCVMGGVSLVAVSDFCCSIPTAHIVCVHTDGSQLHIPHPFGLCGYSALFHFPGCHTVSPVYGAHPVVFEQSISVVMFPILCISLSFIVTRMIYLFHLFLYLCHLSSP